MTLAGIRHRWQGRGFVEPIPVVRQITGAPEGGFHNWVVPAARELPDGTTIIGFVNGSSGSVRVVRYDAATGAIWGPYNVHAGFQVDAHNPPALLPRLSDGRILAAYSRHNDNPFNVKVSTNPLDVSSWGAATALDPMLGGTRYTDMSLHQLDAETGDPIWLVYRDEPSAGTDSRWCRSRSLDDGATWSAQQILFRQPSTRSYMTTVSDGQGRIHFVVTNGGSTSGGYSGFTAIGHFYYEAGAYFLSDGTPIVPSPPFSFANVSLVYHGTSTSVFMENVSLDAAGLPVIAIGETKAGGALAVRYARFDGAAWSSTELAEIGAGYQYNAGGAFGAYGGCIDDGDPDVAYVLVQQGSYPEVFEYRTADGGATFRSRRLSSGSSSLATALIPVRGRTTGLRAVYLFGSWTHYTNWSMGIRAIAPPGSA